MPKRSHTQFVYSIICIYARAGPTLFMWPKQKAAKTGRERERE